MTLHEHHEKGWREWNGRAQFTIAGWSIMLDERWGHQDLYRAARDEEDYVATHTMILERDDGSAFAADEADVALEALQFGLSFALGHWVCPVAPTGVGSHGRVVWADWRPWRADPPADGKGWWNRGRVDPDLGDLLEVVLDGWSDPNERHPLRIAMSTALAAVDTGYVEQRLTTAVTTLEMLSWVTDVRGGNVAERDWWNDGARRIRRLLARANIETKLRSDRTPALLTWARNSSHADGVRAVVDLRHRLTHPKDNSDLYAVPEMLGEASRLALHFLELAILNYVGYVGEVEDRTDVGRWTGTSEPVPWVGMC